MTAVKKVAWTIMMPAMALVLLATAICAASPAAGSSAVDDDAHSPESAPWKLRGGALEVLDGPGSGRYTQVRVGADGLATLVWNGEPGLRLARCADRRCSTITEPRTVLNSSGLPITNPRFVRMELAASGNPVLAFAIADDTQATVMHCGDPHCASDGVLATVLVTAAKVRHCDLALDPAVAGRAVVTFGLSYPPPPPATATMMLEDCVTCSGFRDQACLAKNYTAFSECNCGGGGCDCSSCCAGQAMSDCCSVAPHTSGCIPDPPAATSNGSTLLAFHMHTPTTWTHVVVASAAAAFGVNETSGLPTGGLEMPTVVNRDAQRWAPDLAYWDVEQRRVAAVRGTANLRRPHPPTPPLFD